MLVASLLAASSAALAAAIDLPTSTQPTDLVANTLRTFPRRNGCTPALTDHYLYNLTLRDFTSLRSALSPSCFDWSSDGCSGVDDAPCGYPFLAGCQRHDFAYRNLAAQGRFTEENRLRADWNLFGDLKGVCQEREGEDRHVCEGFVTMYFLGVRAFGGTMGEREGWAREKRHFTNCENGFARV